MHVGLCMEWHLPDLPGNAWTGEATLLDYFWHDPAHGKAGCAALL